MNKTKSWKISFVVSVSPTNFEAVGQGDWKHMIKFISSIGYDGVELAIRDPEPIDISELQSILDKYRLKLVAIGTGQAYVDEGLSLTDDQKSIRVKTIERLKKHIDLANIFDSYIIIGLIRGSLGGNIDERNVRFSYFRNSMLEVADYAFKKNVTVAIEPLNRYECDFLNRADEVVSFITETDCTNIGILLDTFHMNIEEKNIHDAIIESQPFLKHIHIADSNRWYPGEGHLDFSKILDTLRRIKYSGFLSGEMLPLPDLQTAMTNHINKMKEVYNG